MPKFYMPLDPDCPGAQDTFYSIECLNDDPMTEHYGVDVAEFATPMINKHRAECDRCQDFGAAHIEVITDD